MKQMAVNFVHLVCILKVVVLNVLHIHVNQGNQSSLLRDVLIIKTVVLQQKKVSILQVGLLQVRD